MKENLSRWSERRRELVAEIGRIPVVIEGALSRRERQRGGARATVSHQLQRWRSGHNDTRHVPADRVDAVRSGLEGYQQLQGLVAELAHGDEHAVLSRTPSDSKKKPTKP